MLDVFKNDAFGLVSLTMATEKMPYQPGRLGKLGIFNVQGIAQTNVIIEEKYGKLSLVQTSARGTVPKTQSTEKRIVKSFPLLWLPQTDTVIADEVQNIRAFGTEDATAGVAQTVNDKLSRLKQNLEVTKEYHRIGAIQGSLLDADGSTERFNWFTEFGISETEIDVDFSDLDLDIKVQVCMPIIRALEDALGAQTYGKIRVFCGDDFFDQLIWHPSVKDAYRTWQTGLGALDAVFTINSPQVQREGFPFGGIIWENYRGSVGSVKFIPDDVGRVVVDGVPDLFKEFYGPPPFTETVNTIGKPWYAKQQDLDWDLGVELLLVCCPLIMPTRPKVLIKLNMTGAQS